MVTGYNGQFDPTHMFWITRAQSALLENNGDWQSTIAATGSFQILNLSNFTQVANASSLDAHENVQLTVSLVDDRVGDIDTFYDQGGWTWNPTDNLAVVMQTLGLDQGGGGGYTQGDRDAAAAAAATGEETNQLAQAVNAATTAVINLGSSIVNLPIGQVLSSNASDAFRVEDLGGGVGCEPIRVDISRGNYYGVTVRVTQYPDDTVFRTPDGAWSFKDLAVLTVSRGGDILARHGIHTTSHTLSPLPETPYPWLTNLGVPIQPSDYHVAVDWAEGVCGELLGVVLP